MAIVDVTWEKQTIPFLFMKEHSVTHKTLTVNRNEHKIIKPFPLDFIL